MQKAAILRTLHAVRKFMAEQRVRITRRERAVLFCDSAALLPILNDDDDDNNKSKKKYLLIGLFNQ